MAYSPDPLSANWSYDSAIDLFSLNTMLPEPGFPMDIPNDMDMLWDTKELPVDFFNAPSQTDINGFAVSRDDLSSDQESDDQSFSPTNFIASPPPPPSSSACALDLPSPMQVAIKQEPVYAGGQQTVQPCQTQVRVQTQPHQPKRKASSISTASSSRYASSSPEIQPQNQAQSRKTRASTSTSTSNANQNQNQPENEGGSTARGRNAAKRAAHNIIEKRYRTNMNAKFVALEKAMAVKASGVSKQVSSTASHGSSANKSCASLKKSEILSNAIAYMQELQEVNERLRKEISVLGRERRYS